MLRPQFSFKRSPASLVGSALIGGALGLVLGVMTGHPVPGAMFGVVVGLVAGAMSR